MRNEASFIIFHSTYIVLKFILLQRQIETLEKNINDVTAFKKRMGLSQPLFIYLRIFSL